MDLMPGTIITPLGEVVVNRFAVRVILWEIPPGTSRTQDIENAIDDLAQIHRGRTTIGYCGR